MLICVLFFALIHNTVFYVPKSEQITVLYVLFWALSTIKTWVYWWNDTWCRGRMRGDAIKEGRNSRRAGMRRREIWYSKMIFEFSQFIASSIQCLEETLAGSLLLLSLGKSLFHKHHWGHCHRKSSRSLWPGLGLRCHQLRQGISGRKGWKKGQRNSAQTNIQTATLKA